MSELLVAIILIILAILFYYFDEIKEKYIEAYKKYIKSIESILTINFIDFKNSNDFNEMNIKISENNQINTIISSNVISIPISGFKNKTILECEITIKNSTTNECRKFKSSIYKNYQNNINIFLNNNTNRYYTSEIIFFGKINEILLNNNFKCDKFNLNNRLRCVILNIDIQMLIKIITDNNKHNNELNLKIHQALLNIKNNNLLINIFMGENKSNVLIFSDEEQTLITANESEKQLISEFYRSIMKIINNVNKDIDDDINKLCLSLKNALLSNKTLFGININNEMKDSIIFSYINQGVNFLFENNILNEKDKDFIYGCLILLLYTKKNIFSLDYKIIKNLNDIINQMKINKFNIFDQIKASIAYVSFYIHDEKSYILKITSNLDNNSPYKKAFDFYKSIIGDLNEESELMLMFLQLNSGSGNEILNNKSCYKISMIQIDEIKEHLIRNIPNYFFCYNDEKGEDIAITDPKTQIIGFNEQLIFTKRNKILSENEINNNIMNVLIGMFHEGGHQKYHMNIKERAKNEPILFITKEYNLESQDIMKKIKENQEYVLIIIYIILYSFLPKF